MSINVGLVQINNSFSNSTYFPYSVGVLQAYFQRHGKSPGQFEFLDPLFFRMPPSQAVEKLSRAQIVGFSTYVWNFRISLEIAKRLKAAKPDILIVFGGPHVPDRAEAFLRKNPYIDLVCHGEGEVAFTKILDNSLIKNWEDVPSVSYFRNDEFCTNPRAPRITDLSTIPSPYLEGIFKNLLNEKLPFQLVGLWETNRGCPFSCTYCDWGSATQSRMYNFDFSRLQKEIDWFADNQVEYIFCCDSNFGILARDVDIVQCVAETKRKKGYPKALSVQNTKNATERSYLVQKILSSENLNKGVTLALQTVDRTTLENVGRKNISIESFRELQRRYNEDGIETYTDLIIGLPGETYESFADGTSDIIADGQHNRIQFINLSILPNARMGDPEYQKKYGLEIVETKAINHHGALYASDDFIEETQELVVGTKTMPPEDWLKTRIFSWMCSFLYFNKILQIPFLLLHKLCGFSFRELVDSFLGNFDHRFPIVAEINSFFVEEATKLQMGGPEYFPSREWLSVYWPHDEYVFIRLCVDNKMDKFFNEAEDILTRFMQSKRIEIPAFFHETMLFNYRIINQPKPGRDMSIQTKYNIWETYVTALTGDDVVLVEGQCEYRIERNGQARNSLEEWLREVVWYGNKKGAYLYPVRSATPAGTDCCPPGDQSTTG